MDKTFTATELKLLKKHLQAIVEVEFFTIPFYLTAVYSFTQTALNYTPDGGKSYPLNDLQQETLSVAVQEMYHLQLACNLANAFDVKPLIPHLSFRAGQTLKVPHLEEKGKELETRFGNLPAVIKAMIEVETPDPDHTFPEPNPDVIYSSISDLYHATLQLLKKYHLVFKTNALDKDPHFTPDHRQVAYNGFDTQYNYNKISQRSEVVHVANAIADQGEGNEIAKSLGGPFMAGDDGNILPKYQSNGSRFDDYNKVTHYKRFEGIRDALPPEADWPGYFYSANGSPSPDLLPWARALGYGKLQSSLNAIWSYLIDTLQSGFQDGKLQQPNYPDINQPGFNEAMLTFKYLIPIIWQWGQCPSFVYREGVTPDQIQPIMDEIDPLCLFHWDQRTRELRAQAQKAGEPLNSCQGLNDCAGQGWGGLATQKGDGACATADFHTCSGGNDCKYQGGCGFLLDLPASKEWIPNENQKAGEGGCQTPISTGQVFDRKAKPDDPRLKQLIGHNVWQEARALFQKREKLDRLPNQFASGKIGDTTYDGDARRSAVQPTSK